LENLGKTKKAGTVAELRGENKKKHCQYWEVPFLRKTKPRDGNETEENAIKGQAGFLRDGSLSEGKGAEFGNSCHIKAKKKRRSLQPGPFLGESNMTWDTKRGRQKRT